MTNKSGQIFLRFDPWKAWTFSASLYAWSVDSNTPGKNSSRRDYEVRDLIVRGALIDERGYAHVRDAHDHNVTLQINKFAVQIRPSIIREADMPLEKDAEFRDSASTVGALVVNEHSDIVYEGLHMGMVHDSLNEGVSCFPRTGRGTAGRNGNQSGGLMSRVEAGGDRSKESLMDVISSCVRWRV
jgi:hypothetical protein